MATVILGEEPLAQDPKGPDLDRAQPLLARLLFIGVLLAGAAYAIWGVMADTRGAGEVLGGAVLLFLALALLIALGFEFVNGFHDTANAVATVIYTHALPAHVAVVWAGIWNLIGVLASTGAVAYSIIALLPVELILNVGSSAGFAMIFALLISAVLWNLATWYVGLPNSSSHTLIGSVLGVGFANQLLTAGSTGGTAGVDWSQATKVLNGLWMAPLIGFFAAMLLLFAMRLLLSNPRLFKAPEGDAPPPIGIRGLLIFTCTAVSFSHGSNDGQKGMGLIMLILIGCAPAAYAVNRTLTPTETAVFAQSATIAAGVYDARAGADMPLDQARAVVTTALRERRIVSQETYGGLETLARDVGARLATYGALANAPRDAVNPLRSDMYLLLDGTKLTLKDKGAGLVEREKAALTTLQQELESGTRFIPLWVKVAVAIALGLGTMVGWKRIVITVGERIGKQHMTYGMGASAELVAAGTILAADKFGLPVSTTHILSSGVAGASVASGHGLQARTVINMALAWVTTLPVTIALSGGLYWLFLLAAGVR